MLYFNGLGIANIKFPIIKILLNTSDIRDRYVTQARENRLKNASISHVKIYDY